MIASRIERRDRAADDVAAEQQAARERRRAQPLPQAEPPRQQHADADLDAHEEDELHAHAGERVGVAVVRRVAARGRLDRLGRERQAEAGRTPPRPPGGRRRRAAAEAVAERLHHVLRQQAAHQRHRRRLRRVVVDRDDRLGAAEHERARRLGAEPGRHHDRRRAPCPGARARSPRPRRRGDLERRVGLDRRRDRLRQAARVAVDEGDRDLVSACRCRPPKIAPKNAAMTIGAAIDMTSARRFEK